MAKAKDIEGLECGAEALGDIKLVLGTRLAEMCALGERAKDWSNIEGVHDMRVASRRFRSALKDFEAFVRRPKEVRALGAEVKKIADALGVVRDQDVAIAALEKLSEKAPAEARDGVERLAAERRRKREAGREALGELIAESALAGLQARWGAALEKLSPPSNPKNRTKSAAASDGDLSFGDAGRIVIATRWDELDELSASLYRPFKVGPLHDMRIAAKKLRYALELFSPCHGDALDAPAKEVAGMQSSLGELHDCDVWIEWLGGLLREYAGGGGRGGGSAAPAAARQEDLRAAVWLMRHFSDERAKHYRAALSRWGKWRLDGFGEKLRARLGGGTAATEAPAPESAARHGRAAKTRSGNR